ncbi:hybrid sensor histidine kinase/response regulator [Opitutaceae bacterium EW11]|nr:hybrid sensor histidine kinase/response regulator [Opitutaceae bacterium EW11]
MSSSPPPHRILVVDDQESNVRVVGNILGELGFTIVPATSGEQALRRLAAKQPDLVLLDVLMPGMDGFEVCRRIRESTPEAEIPIIFLSAADDKGLIVRALEGGGVDYVTKPFNPAELISRVRTHLALKAARDSLRQLAEDKDELLGILAHDLKNHLGGMQMTAQLLSDRASGAGDQALKRMAGNILTSTGQMLAFVKQFLANASADRGLTMKIEPVCLRTAALKVHRHYTDAAERKGIQLHQDLPETGVHVLADQSALEQVLENLISNAVKFSAPGKSVWIRVEATPDSGRCIIRDEGPGFTPEDRSMMFRRYRRLSATPTAGEPSTGLGLSIVKKLMDALDGRIECESVPGQGATFTVELPPAIRDEAS